MKALQFGKFFPPDVGGMENFIYEITENLSQKINCDVLCSNSKNKTVVEKRDKYTIIRTASLGKIFSTSISPTMIYQLKKICNNYDLIHIHLPDPMASLAYFVVRPKTKLVIHWHSDIIKQKNFLIFYKPLQNWLLNKADKIIVTSFNYLNESKNLKKYKDKCVVISLGINPKNLKINQNKVKEIKNLYKDKAIIFTLGRLVYYKGFSYLIKAMQNIDAYLLLGGEGPLKEKLQKEINDLKLNNKIFLLGKIKNEEIGSYYQSCDIFCLPSISKAEAFGLVQIEAMYFGKPIVSTNIKGSGVGWVNQNNITGFVVPPRDSEALADAINKILNDKELKEKLGENGKKRFEREFNIKVIGKKILNLYKDIIKI
ncbi:MAG TPA: glycosyltransferase [Candidatus Pacearchaeota archaeon]|nr:glycosyltransferase [Candidatus Pacearchaeota archaeon]HPO68522.1 glycosyltransferase [Candidatus Pacearchaeota archaeon]